MYGRQPHLPIHVTQGLAPNLAAVPTSTKYVQKIRECIRWAHRKADLFQQREAEITNRIMTNAGGQYP